MKDQISVSDNSKISLPVRNLLALLAAATAFGIFAYTEITSRLTSLENSRHIMEADLITKSDQKIRGPGAISFAGNAEYIPGEYRC